MSETPTPHERLFDEAACARLCVDFAKHIDARRYEQLLELFTPDGMLDRMGANLAHVHLADGSGGPRDEHLVPGRGTQPCAEVCQRLADSGFAGVVVIEISTRRCRNRYDRMTLLAESLLFARLHLQPVRALS